MEVGLVQKIDIDDEMQQAYLDYAMSVIVARALPDARDGLKPVHRRILYAMYDMGLRPDSTYKKSARIVGEVLGKYHPHGDMAVYEAMARMAQDFSMRYRLVDGQGNFGSVDGDPPAAMRYTEARITEPAFNMLADIQKNTVNFEENFDGTLREPVVLPSAVPNLLVNGATGIAVGMSTSVPPHNLSEVIEALKYLLENWERMDDIDVEDLMRFIQGPDFPTGGIILQEAGGEGLAAAYGSGRGRVIVQARAHLEEMERSRSRIIVTELPYMTNKASLIERIAELVREERLEGIVDLRDESDRQGMRIVIELSKNIDPEAVLRNLYKHTPMQSTFSIIMLALVDGEPRMLSLKQALRVYLEHRLEIIRRRTEYDLDRARQRAHILEGLRVALKNLDEVIELIRKAPDVETARARLMKRFKLSEIQAQAILDMQLRRLAALERKKIEEEYKEVLALIKDLENLLRSPKKMRQVAAEELQVVKDAYGDVRRTQIVYLKEGEKKISLLTATELTPEKTVWVAVTREGLISRTREDKLPALSGDEAPVLLLRANSRDTLYLVCEQGEAAAISIHTIPESETPAGGAAVSKITPLREQNRLAGLFTLPAKTGRNGGLPELEGRFVLTATRQAMVKKSAASELPGPSNSTFTLVKVNEGDRLGWVGTSDGKAEIILVTAGGMAIRFNEEEVRPMGLVAAGVNGIKLQAGDEIAGMALLPTPGDVFLLASDGSAKRVPVDQFSRQGRYGQGLQAWKLAGQVRMVGITIGQGSQRAILRLEKLPPKTIRLDEAPLVNRAARGRPLSGLRSAGSILGLTVPHSPGEPVTGEPEKAERKSRSRSQQAASDGKSKTKEASGKPAAKRVTRQKTADGKESVTGRGKKTASTKPAGAVKPASPAKPGATASKTTTRKVAAKPAGAAAKPSTRSKPATAAKPAAVTEPSTKPARKTTASAKKTAATKAAAPAAESKQTPSRRKPAAAAVKPAGAAKPAAAAKATPAKASSAQPAAKKSTPKTSSPAAKPAGSASRQTTKKKTTSASQKAPAASKAPARKHTASPPEEQPTNATIPAKKTTKKKLAGDTN